MTLTEDDKRGRGVPLDERITGALVGAAVGDALGGPVEGYSPEQIAERIAAYRKRGVDLILGGFLHFQEEIEYFGARVLPLVREIEASDASSADAPALATV